MIQLWAHAYRQNYHSGVDTNNFTESFNNVLRRRYLPLRHDTTIHALVKILVEVAFPEQETRYIQATIKRTGAYRKPRYEIPCFLQDRPESVQSLCLLNIQRGTSIPSSYIIQQDPPSSGKFKLKKTSSDSEGDDDKWEVDVCNGTCTCPSFISAHVPCKHMFAIFHTGIQGYRGYGDTRIQRIRGYRGYRDTRIRGYKDTGIRGYKDTGIQGYRGYGDTRIRGYKDTGIQGYGDTEDTEIQRIQGYGDTRIRGYKDTEDTGYRGYGATEDTGIQGYGDTGIRDTEIQGYGDTRIQRIRGYKDTGIQGYRGYEDTGIQEYGDTWIRGYRGYGDTRIQRIRGYKDTGIQRYRGYGDTRIWGYRGYRDTRIRGYRDTEDTGIHVKIQGYGARKIQEYGDIGGYRGYRGYGDTQDIGIREI